MSIPTGSATTRTSLSYAPLLRPVAEFGYGVYIVKLPWRFAPLQSHKEQARRRADDLVRRVPSRWVISGHSLGAALAVRFALAHERSIASLVLIGTTHPKTDDLSSLTIPVTKVYGSNDGIAPVERIMAGKRLLPAHTRWAEIQAGIHSQFGNYGHQLMDGKGAIARQQQQRITRDELLVALGNAARWPANGSADARRTQYIMSARE